MSALRFLRKSHYNSDKSPVTSDKLVGSRQCVGWQCSYCALHAACCQLVRTFARPRSVSRASLRMKNRLSALAFGFHANINRNGTLMTGTCTLSSPPRL